MAKRTRITTTVREDNPVPARSRGRKNKQSTAIIIVILLVLLGLLLVRSRQVGTFHPGPISTQPR